MHPSEKQLIDFALAETGPEETRRIGRHLDEQCAACNGVVDQYRDLLLLMTEDRTPEPPAAWVERAIALGRPSWIARVREWCAGLREEAGRVVFDSFAVPGLAGAGVRSAETERRLRFVSRDVELDVRVEPVGRGGVVTGQLADIAGEPAPLANARFLLTAGTADPVEGEADDFGEFSERVADLADLRLRVVCGDRVVSFEIPEAPSGGD
jgi:hypothetical protein